MFRPAAQQVGYISSVGGGRAMSPNGTKRTQTDVALTSAFGSKADWVGGLLFVSKPFRQIEIKTRLQAMNEKRTCRNGVDIVEDVLAF